MSFWDNQSFSFPQDRENRLCPWADIRRPPKESSSGGRYAKRERKGNESYRAFFRRRRTSPRARLSSSPMRAAIQIIDPAPRR